jgi:hypothetical protein
MIISQSARSSFTKWLSISRRIKERVIERRKPLLCASQPEKLSEVPSDEVKAESTMNSKVWLALLLAAGVGIRFAFCFIAEPRAFLDTGTYVDLANQLLSGDFSNYEGRRTPGYSLLLILARFSPNAVWVIQMLAGLAISACLFYIVYELTGRPSFAFFAGMTYNLNLGHLFFEANLIPEIETTFFVVATASLLTLIHRRFRDSRRVAGILVVAGIFAASAVMSRPQFVFLPILLGIFTGYGSLIIARSRWGVAFARACLSAGPGIFMILAWSWFNYSHVGHFTMSTQTGIGLTEHTIAFAELAPERYGILRDVLVMHRDIHIAQTGRHTATWDALPELKKVTGLRLPDLDRELLKMSATLILEHPLRYAVLVADAWVSFWLVSDPKELKGVKPVVLAELLAWIWSVEHLLLRIINATFLIFVGTAIFSSRFRHWTQWGFVFTTISVIALFSSILQALVIGVDNTRYGVTVQGLIVLIVITALYQVLRVRIPVWRGRSLSTQGELTNGGAT